MNKIEVEQGDVKISTDDSVTIYCTDEIVRALGIALKELDETMLKWINSKIKEIIDHVESTYLTKEQVKELV